MNSLREAPKEVFNLYLQTVTNIINNVDEAPQKQMLDELTEMVEKSCMLDVKLKQSNEILNRLSSAKNNQNEDPEAIDHQQILDQFKNEVAGINTDVSKNATFLDFKHQLKIFLEEAATNENEANNDDDDLVLTDKQINVIDPITKKRIVDPVRNTICGHVYDRDSVTALVKGNKHTRCPVVGCANKDYILVDNLQTDILTKRYLDKNPE